jgi:hypothetical protein
MKHNDQWVAAQRAGVEKAWQDPSKFKRLRNQSADLIEKRIAPLRGRKRDVAVCKKISAALTGRKLSDEHKAKALRTGWRGPNSLTEEQQKRRNASISKSKIGTHGYGKAERDRPDHCKALHWIVMDSYGQVYEFDNLSSWARKHEALFLPDERPESKLPLWRRAVGGFINMRRTDKKASHHWRGWTLVSGVERSCGEVVDLLNRKLMLPLPDQTKEGEQSDPSGTP